MTLTEAKHILGNRAAWELKQMIRALSMLPALNSPEDNQRLAAAKIVLKSIRKRK